MYFFNPRQKGPYKWLKYTFNGVTKGIETAQFLQLWKSCIENLVGWNGSNKKYWVINLFPVRGSFYQEYSTSSMHYVVWEFVYSSPNLQTHFIQIFS